MKSSVSQRDAVNAATDRVEAVYRLTCEVEALTAQVEVLTARLGSTASSVLNSSS